MSQGQTDNMQGVRDSRAALDAGKAVAGIFSLFASLWGSASGDVTGLQICADACNAASSTSAAAGSAIDAESKGEADTSALTMTAQAFSIGGTASNVGDTIDGATQEASSNDAVEANESGEVPAPAQERLGTKDVAFWASIFKDGAEGADAGMKISYAEKKSKNESKQDEIDRKRDAVYGRQSRTESYRSFNS